MFGPVIAAPRRLLFLAPSCEIVLVAAPENDHSRRAAACAVIHAGGARTHDLGNKAADDKRRLFIDADRELVGVAALSLMAAAVPRLSKCGKMAALASNPNPAPRFSLVLDDWTPATD